MFLQLPFSVGPPAANIAFSGDMALGRVYDPGFFKAPTKFITIDLDFKRFRSKKTFLKESP